jgi:hypothetical protein
VHRILLQNPVVINEFFVHRTEAWFRIVIQEGLGFEDSGTASSSPNLAAQSTSILS